MKTLQLYDAYYFLSRCAGLLLEGRYIEPILSEIEDDYENEFLVLSWEERVEVEEDIFQTSIVEVSFKEGDNQTIGLEGCTLTLTNSEGDDEELTLLQEWHPLVK